jgi:hypothetical protein
MSAQASLGAQGASAPGTLSSCRALQAGCQLMTAVSANDTPPQQPGRCKSLRTLGFVLNELQWGAQAAVLIFCTIACCAHDLVIG